ncbi:MAG: hypothetical protein JXD22_09170 [Sedimentisphaerales bacterium]|nr:hypothetical protein [Sedimentisphaerales bacterium]
MFRFDIKLVRLLLAMVLSCIFIGSCTSKEQEETASEKVTAEQTAAEQTAAEQAASEQSPDQKPSEIPVVPLAPLSLDIIKEIPEMPGGQQGIATDGSFIYIQAKNLLKFDMEGKLICQSEPQDIHGGGITHHDKKIYVASSKCDPAGTKVHKVYVYNAQDLKKIAEYDIGEHFGICAGGIAYYDNHFYVAESYWDNDHYDYIVKFDEEFNFVASYQVEFKCPYGIQGLDYIAYLGVFQVNSHGKDFYRINTNFDSGTVEPGRAPFDLQDVACLNQNTLLYNDRAGRRIVFSGL